MLGDSLAGVGRPHASNESSRVPYLLVINPHIPRLVSKLDHFPPLQCILRLELRFRLDLLLNKQRNRLIHDRQLLRHFRSSISYHLSTASVSE